MFARKMMVRMGAVLALGAMNMLGGCHAEWTAAGLSTVAYQPVAAVIGTGIIVAASSEKHGPSGTFLNDSDERLWVRWWVGRVDCRVPEGVTDWRTPGAFVVEPGEKVTEQLGRNWWATGNSDAVVRVSVRPVVSPEEGWTNDETSPVQWYEFERKPPYFMKAVGNRADLALMSFGKGSINPVPTEQQFIGVNDDFPILPAQTAAAGM